jgi:phage baseplate assembly protein gpV
MTTIGAIAPAISINGSPMPKSLTENLVQMRIERGLGLVGRATLRFRDGGYKFSAGGMFKLGHEVAVRVPAAGELMSGTVVGISLEQPRGDVPELVVVIDDAAFKLARGTQVNTYLNVGYADVIVQLARRHGLTAKVQAVSGTQEYLLQNSTDLAFLNSIVERIGYVWWIDGLRDLMVQKVDKGAPVLTLTNGENLVELSVRASGLRPTTLKVNGWNPDQQADVTGTHTSSSTAPPSLLSDYDGATPARTLTAADAALSDIPALTVEEANAMATGLLGDWAAAAVVARGTCEISSKIKPGTTVKVADAGPASGTYLVTQVEHVYDRHGFETRFTAGPRRPAALVDTLGAPGPDPGFQALGLVIGVVTDNGDKDGRVKVKYAGVGAKIESPWARVVTLGGGGSRGVVFQPEVGDEVLVGFERGDTRRPVVIGGLFSSQNTLPTAGSGVKQGKVEYRRITSRKNHVIEIADGEAPTEQHVLIRLGTVEHKLRLGADRFDIEVAQGKPVTIKAGSAMFDINAAGNISIEGKNITIKAESNLLLQGGAKAVLDSNAQTQVHGTKVDVKADGMGNIEASGPLTIKGATVAVN